ncbi:MAG: hypothetical protein HC778_02645 [Chamaesiphon sp. CSU_1_12]|nr:hypothetical protein [Chamaesiphon sp. CSU_1_12]
MRNKVMTQIDRNEEMVPPWEEFPDYERYTIGWRMGSGEDYLDCWYDFVEKLPDDYDTRLDYLKSHRPAPLNWCSHVFGVLSPDRKLEQKYGCNQAETIELLNLGLVEHDAAYHTWLKQQDDLKLPWYWFASKTPEEAARYHTREFWFLSRQLTTLRKHDDFSIEDLLEDMPSKWQSVELQLTTRQLGDLDPSSGLLTLARMLCAGSVLPPWELGLAPDDGTDSFEMDMGYVDAFRMWIMSAFDDDMLLRTMLQKTGIPDNWAEWIEEETDILQPRNL